MGCINTKRETEVHPNIYRVINVDSDGIPLWSGTLEISPRELTLYRKGKEPTKWALQHLRRYGFDADLFTFEAGRRCTTGEGIYAFRCRRAESLFHLLQSYIHGIATHEDNISTGLQLNDGHQNSNSQIITSRSSSGGGVGSIPVTGVGQNLQNINYVIPANRNITWNNGQSSGFTRSTDTLTGDYLDPTPIRHTLDYRHSAGMRLSSIGSGSVGGQLSPGEPNSPSSPNSLNVILEVTQLNELYQQSYQNSNLYQEFPLRSNEHNNNILNKKLSLDIPPQEPAPVITNGQPSININSSCTSTIFGTHFKNLDSPPEMMSPILSENNAERPYVNVTPGEIDSLIGTPTTTTQINFSLPRLSSSTYSFEPSSSTRCYENLDLSVTGTPSSSIILSSQLARPKRFSKPEIFTKFDLPLMINSSSIDNSEPSTPISISSTTGSGGSGVTSKDTRKVNYIVLDLDQSSGINVTNNITTTITTTTESTLNISNSCTDSVDIVNTSSSLSSSSATTNQTNNLISHKSPSTILLSNVPGSSTPSTKLTNTGQIQTHLLSPESPKKASLGYATIDFNKTAALSNSTAPSLDDSEGSRKTRHSVSVRQSNSISE